MRKNKTNMELLELIEEQTKEILELRERVIEQENLIDELLKES